MSAIEFDGVTKQFGDITAVSDLSLKIETGEVFGFLGPNGAGKSTTINMLLDFVRPTTGTVTALGVDAHTDSVAVRRRTGVLPEGFDVYDRLSGRAHIEFAVDSKEVDVDPTAILDRVGLIDAADRPASGYSKGMQQRLALGMALSGDPDLLILDEPASGLDPAGTKAMRDIVREEAANGTTVFFSSHVLEQVEAVCDRVGIMQAGNLIAVDSIDGLRKAADVETIVSLTLAAGDIDTAVNTVSDIKGVDTVTQNGSQSIQVSCESAAKTAVITELETVGIDVADFETESASLEDLFLAYTESDDAVNSAESNRETTQSTNTATVPTETDEGTVEQ
ncbi:ABC transporter ATP-binding protein [Haloquadratum walsbyi]|uniref:ABC-type multidrug transport system, ATPase component n=1 Tax=Haloquadratum walsbyi J07HQW2 TaxID=1238425 RepID=U1NGE1_9EURY|nr:ABC transporter ATP-binding protein [Haloquadratum walsbyi]ERG95873.1 MAG: ABC-type multidrug transport system, ATPase component [Haloquadratum walsbyi J07HQW2]